MPPVTSVLVQQLSLSAPQLVIPVPPRAQLGGGGPESAPASIGAVASFAASLASRPDSIETVSVSFASNASTKAFMVAESAPESGALLLASLSVEGSVLASNSASG
jgi:hypothetical protein